MVYGALAFMLILVTVAATSLYLERKRLFTLADGRRARGAEAFPLDTVAIESDTSDRRSRRTRLSSPHASTLHPHRANASRALT
jgi:hypothetical protein